MSFHCKLQETKDSDIFFTIVSQCLAWHTRKRKINLCNLNDWINNNPYFRILTEDKEGTVVLITAISEAISVAFFNQQLTS